MGFSSLLKPKSSGYKNKSGSSVGSDKEMNGKLRRQKIKRPSKMNEYGLKRIPDYTELAYKEAVSKLRYFLSGNYAPSVRSFGSPSIKNLDESDADDKKYSAYTTLAEYKPRPRLTAKYATLYADSLSNDKARNISVPPPAPADLSGGTNPDVVNFIQKQEEYIEQLERESQYCRDELNNLLGKVKEVISENENLHEAQKNKIISRMFHSYNGGSETDDLDDLGDSTGLDSDNKATPKRRSAKARSTRLEGPNIVFESRISELEAQLAQAKIDFKKIQEENNENKRKLSSGLVDSTCLDGFKRQIDNLQRDKSSLESQISKLKLSLEQKDLSDLDGRFKRSDVEIQLREERNNLEAELRNLKDELAKERSKVRELATDGARRAIQERCASEQRYAAHCDELQRDLAAQYEHQAKLQLELERQRRDENDLKRELSIKNAAIEDLKMELKNKTAILQADLAQANAEKASLEEELASARLAIERNQRQAKHETNRLNSEIQSVRQRLDRADADVVHARRENLRLSDLVHNLEKEINIKNLSPMSPEKKKKEKEISSMFENMENKHAKTVAELESMIHSQNSLMEKLTGECRLLTDKLDDANRRHKEQLATLHRQVDYLTETLQTSQTHAPNAYEAPTPHQPATDRTIPQPSTTGPDYSGSDATGYTQVANQPVSSVRDVGGDGRDRDNHVPSRRVSKQNSRSSLYNQEASRNEVKTFEPANTVPTNEYVEEEPVTQELDAVARDKEYSEKEYKDRDDKDKPAEYETKQHEDQDYVAGDQQYDPQNYSEQDYQQNVTDDQYQQEQHYQETPSTEVPYQDQSYEQQPYVQETQDYNQAPQDYNQEQQEFTPDQQGYTQEQYENYEQYPQQFADPNAQYEEGYTADPSYAGDPNYDQTQYQDYTETQEQPLETTEVKQNVPVAVNNPKGLSEDVTSTPTLNQHEQPKVGKNGKSSPPKGKTPGKS